MSDTLTPSGPEPGSGRASPSGPQTPPEPPRAPVPASARSGPGSAGEDLAAIDTPRAILERLVAFPTVSRDSNLALVDWVEAWLAARGIDAVRVPNAGGDKASLYAHVGPRTDGGVLLSGHTDVVPVDGQDWSCDPWTVTERDGRLYGRGTADMKGFDALALWAMGEAARRGLARPLQIALSRDEEIGCVGAPEMLAHMAGSGFPRAEAAIIGEPTGMACVTAHKSSLGYHVTVRGHEVHSSMPHRGVSAVMEAARLIDWANRTNSDLAARPPSEVAALFDPPWSSLHVGMIEGGTAHNIMARTCRFGLGLRTVPDEPLDDWRARIEAAAAEVARGMQEIEPSTGIELTEGFLVPPLAPEPDGAAERLVRALTGDNGTHGASYGTEAGQFQQAGYSAVVCGPGDIAQAHQADEYLALEQLEAGQRMMAALVDRLAAR